MSTGSALVKLAAKHVGETYVFGARAPKDNPNWTGPWDCAEFASWLVFQASDTLFGCDRNDATPSLADAFTGFWARDSKTQDCTVTVDLAARTPGAFVLRLAQPGAVGHIVVSDGAGGTIEAHSAKRGVIQHTLNARSWDFGILPPTIEYTEGPALAPVTSPPKTVLRLTTPNQSGPLVRRLQRALRDAGFNPGPIDGSYGPMTVTAVFAFQVSKKLVPDGEAGPMVAKSLGIEWE